MEDQYVNRSLKSVKIAMTLLENALDQPRAEILSFIWSNRCSTGTPVEDMGMINLARSILTDFHANCVKPRPLVPTNERTPFCESMIPIFKYFSAATGFLSLVMTVNSSELCKQFGVSYPGIGTNHILFSPFRAKHMHPMHQFSSDSLLVLLHHVSLVGLTAIPYFSKSISAMFNWLIISSSHSAIEVADNLIG
ncbi:hypothetical protein DM01DRAFT_1315509 [Hesseltinella vesiculosa]|uniref:Uncharacterized protein n=1 Tax=Hesseltinella vesiculosa TaxID=101127 RepID=A0A1X2GVT2_9FUNG|nr:hypothetical protein DM01DRAFT_1315509 [Hesseltinella vesiculosa]